MPSGREPLPYQYYIEVDGKKVADFPAITIEEPVITNNLPDQVFAGQSLSFSTALTNTYYENEKVDELLKQGGYDYYHHVGFRPKVEVLEGNVLQSNQDYTNTLTSSETLTFPSPGRVQLKITYESIHSTVNEGMNRMCEEEGCYDNIYSPSTIVTFDVQEAPPAVTASVDKTLYAPNETITASITTPGTVEKAYFVSETGAGIASARNAVKIRTGPSPGFMSFPWRPSETGACASIPTERILGCPCPLPSAALRRLLCTALPLRPVPRCRRILPPSFRPRSK